MTRATTRAMRRVMTKATERAMAKAGLIWDLRFFLGLVLGLRGSYARLFRSPG